MVDEDLNVQLLEINPGPDFKQTGDRWVKERLGQIRAGQLWLYLYISILVQCALSLFHMEWCIRQAALVLFYHTL